MPGFPAPRAQKPSAVILCLACTLPAANSQAQTCPAASPATALTAASTPGLSSPEELKKALEQPIELLGDRSEASKTGDIDLSGNVEVRWGPRTLSADSVNYQQSTQNIKATGTVQYEDPQLRVSGADAEVSSSGGAQFSEAKFELRAQSARGTAEKIQVNREKLSLDKVTYTSCPEDRKDWELKLSDLDINQTTRTGAGRNVRLDFKGIPILYVPYISFPVGNQRKSGVLFPTLGSTSRGGNELTVPWYWNIAPNYDATFLPTLYTQRGFALGGEFRYLMQRSKGVLTTGYLPYDNVLGRYRNLAHLKSRSDFTESLRLEIDAANVSDNQWFEDFGQGSDATSAVYLNRLLKLSYLKRDWLATLDLHNLQLIDDQIPHTDRPYAVLPQISVRGHESHLPYGLDFRFGGELSNFYRNEIVRAPGEAELVKGQDKVTGSRLYLAPELHMPLRTRGMYVEPAAGWRYIGYRLSDPVVRDQLLPGATAPATLFGRRDPHVQAPVFSLDSGLAFERYSGAHQQRLQTLEPRILYLYIPYRAQDDMPIFDTTEPDLNLVQLFRTDRYVGGDRLGDANQLSVGVTSRMFDADSGQQYLSATVGQAFYFSQPRVVLPPPYQDLLSRNSSDVIAQLNLSAFKNWNIGMGVQWNPESSHSERGDMRVQYNPAKDRVVNLGYSFQRGELEQWSSSFAWPIGPTWATYGKVVYSRQDNKVIERFAGFQYRSCCWNIRLVAGRSISTREGTSDTAIRLQLELAGLSSVGVAADAFLERSIPGYLAR